MPIPPFDGILNVLPPHLGDPTDRGHLSPYFCSTEELVDRFAFSPARKVILDGFLRLRRELMGLGIQGFHWLDGSFMEDVETERGRDPRDIDVVTFLSRPTNLPDIDAVLTPRPELWRRGGAKPRFHVDHFLVPLCSNPEEVVDNTRYWCGLFSHRRDSTWKGMLRVELNVAADDNAAWRIMGARP